MAADALRGRRSGRMDLFTESAQIFGDAWMMTTEVLLNGHDSFLLSHTSLQLAGPSPLQRDRVLLGGELVLLHPPAAGSLSVDGAVVQVYLWEPADGWDVQIKPIFLLTHTAELTHCVWITFLLLYGLCIYVFNIKLYIFTGGTSRQSWISLTADGLAPLLSHCFSSGFFLQHHCYTSAPPRSVFGISHRLFTNSEL